MCEQTGIVDVAVAVRSSSTAEDMPALATKSIKTGMRLRVDGGNGIVTILD